MTDSEQDKASGEGPGTRPDAAWIRVGRTVVAGRSRLRLTGLVIGGVALFAAGAMVAGVAVAGVIRPASSQVIHGCVNTRTRALTIPAGRSCPTGTAALRWNVRGPAGAQGPAGQAGPVGPAAFPGWGVVVSGSGFKIDDPIALLSDGTHIWVANFSGNSLTEINASDGSFVRNLSGGSYNFDHPRALVSDGTHIWVANSFGNSLTEINASDGSFVRNLSGGSYNFNDPVRLAYDGTHIWATNALGNSVTEVNASDGSFVRNLSGGSYNFNGPGAIAFGIGAIWVANVGNNSLTEINASTGDFVRNLAGGPYNFDDPDALLAVNDPINPIGVLWVANGTANGDPNAGSVTEIRTGGTADGTFVRNLSGRPYGFAIPDALALQGTHLWIANDEDSVTEVIAKDGSWVRTPSGGTFGLATPSDLAVAGGQVWVANRDGNSLTELPPG